MSKLDQAKKEAIRLFKIAKKNNKENPYINIKNLSQSREYIATLNGYQDWNHYEKRLKMDDISQSNSSRSNSLRRQKEILNNLDYFNKIEKFQFNEVEINNKEIIIKKDNNYKPIMVGNIIKDGINLSLRGEQIMIDNFPLHVIGNTGSGLTQLSISIVNQLIENKEGVFYLNGHGDTSLYSYLFSLANENKRLKDIYLLNLIKNNGSSRITNKIDPINPLIDYPESFDIIFGKLSKLLYSLCLSVKNNSGFVTIDNLNSFLSLENLKGFLNDHIFKKSNEIIENYLIDIDYYNNLEKAKKIHALNCNETLDFLETIKTNDVFSSQPDISIDEIYKNSKICLVLYPALEKDPEGLTMLTSIIMLQIINAAEKYGNYKILQNLLFSAMDYMLNEKIWNKLLNDFKTDARLHFYSATYIEKGNITNNISKKSNTSIIMKIYDDIPNALKIKVFDYIDNPPPLLRLKYLSQQHPGEAIIFTSTLQNYENRKVYNNKKDYYLIPVKCIYKEIKINNNLYLPN